MGVLVRFLWDSDFSQVQASEPDRSQVQVLEGFGHKLQANERKAQLDE